MNHISKNFNKSTRHLKEDLVSKAQAIPAVKEENNTDNEGSDQDPDDSEAEIATTKE